MRVLFDHNVPHKLRRFLTAYDVQTAEEMGWAELKNGELLSIAQQTGYDVLLTGDKNLQYQQNLESRTLAVVVLTTNNWNKLKVSSEQVVRALQAASPGTFQVVAIL